MQKNLFGQLRELSFWTLRLERRVQGYPILRVNRGVGASVDEDIRSVPSVCLSVC